jgi:hypothetical protein
MAAILESLHQLGPRSLSSRMARTATMPTTGPGDSACPRIRTVHRRWNARAGDAFSPTLMAALVKGYTLEDAIEWAPVNAMRVVQEVGAQSGLLGEEDLLLQLKAAPSGTQ